MISIHAETSSDRPPTPPHFPTYNVHCSPARIYEIIKETLADATLESIQQLPSGQSFNNRIYFLTLGRSGSANPTASTQDLALKISGQFFGPAKVQNEVSCLLLLEKYCPDVPTPRIIAWSENGIDYVKVVRDGPDIRLSQSSTLSQTEGRDHGWILMTRVPGRTLQASDIQSQGESIMRQLAQYIAKIRTIPPLSRDIGNILISASPYPRPEHAKAISFTSSVKMRTQGLLIAGKSPSHSLSSDIQYQTYKISDQLSILESEEIFSPNRTALCPLLHDFISTTLPNLPLLSHPHSFTSTSTSTPKSTPVFTHYDLSPRNVLISPSSSPSAAATVTITAILDLEFAGFFPMYEEFTNSRITHADYWDGSAWEIFTAELRRLGVHVPEGREWEQAVALVEIVEGIAPWYLREGGVRGEELVRELEEAEQRVKRAVERLKTFV